MAEAGGHMSDFSGSAYSISGFQTLASNALIHDEMIAVLQEIGASGNQFIKPNPKTIPT